MVEQATTKALTVKATMKETSTRLVGADGATLRVVAQVDTKGRARTFVIHTARNGDGKPTATHGATQQHPSAEKASEAVKALVATAVKSGWVLPTPRVKVDAFDALHLPVAPKPKK